jgi:hypothetical protein
VESGIVVSGSGDEADVAVDVGANVGVDRLLVEVGAVIDAVVCGVDWAAASRVVAGGRPVVSGCWLHAHSDKPTSALAAAIWIFRNDFIFAIPFLYAGM